MDENINFEELILPKKEFAKEFVASRYDIYKDKIEFVTVTATIVSDAISKSGVDNPYKVVRMGRHSIKDIVGAEKLVKIPDPALKGDDE